MLAPRITHRKKEHIRRVNIALRISMHLGGRCLLKMSICCLQPTANRKSWLTTWGQKRQEKTNKQTKDWILCHDLIINLLENNQQIIIIKEMKISIDKTASGEWHSKNWIKLGNLSSFLVLVETKKILRHSKKKKNCLCTLYVQIF